MWKSLFGMILSMSAAAVPVILIVLGIRLILKKVAPRIFCYALWAVVLVRLLCPVLPRTGFGLVPDGRTVYQVRDQIVGPLQAAEGVSVLSGEAAERAGSAYMGEQPEGPEAGPADRAGDVPERPFAAVPGGKGAVLSGGTAGKVPALSAGSGMSGLAAAGAFLWACIAALLLSRGIFGYLIFREKVIAPLRKEWNGERESIVISRSVQTPFAAGFLHPVIYLPEGLEQAAQDLICEHERVHIRRRDAWIKALAWAVTCVYWFHPLVWLSRYLLERDMEVSCDEAVLKKAGKEKRKTYARTLLFISQRAPRRLYTPVGFGEQGVKERIQNAVRWKPAGRRRMALACVLVAAAAVLLLACGKGTERIGETGGNPAEGSVAAASERQEELASEAAGQEEESSPETAGQEEKSSLKAGQEEESSPGAAGQEEKSVLEAARQREKLALETARQQEGSSPAAEGPAAAAAGPDGADAVGQQKEGNAEGGDLPKGGQTAAPGQQGTSSPEEGLTDPEAVGSDEAGLSETETAGTEETALQDSCAAILRGSEGTAENAESISYVCPVASARISDTFGERVHPITGEKRLHSGVDFAAEKGTPVCAAAEGIVYETGYDAGAGNYVILLHPNGEMTYYAHCADIAVTVQTAVQQGEILATVGNTGRSTGAHLHFAVSRDGQFIQPPDFGQNDSTSG